jgi:cytochrome b561
MKFLLSSIIENVILVTALINIVLILLLFFTCRFIPRVKMTKSMVEKKWFKLLYKYHSYLWWILVPSVLIHAVIALLHIFAGG